MSPAKRRFRARVDGHVQGVGFRYFVHDTAVSLNLSGWVRNTWNGQVEVEAEGSPDDLSTLLDALHRGPRSATVTEVKVDWLEPSDLPAGFEIRSTR